MGWQNIGNITLLRALLTHCYKTGQDALTNKVLLRLFEQLGVDTCPQKSLPAYSPENHNFGDCHEVWDGDTKNLGFMLRDNGSYGSLCLSDCYGEESNGQERSYYED